MAARLLVAVAVVAIVATAAAYVAIIRSQSEHGTPDVLTVPFVASYQLLMALLLLASLVVPAAARPAFRGAASAGLLVLGWLAAMSIGIPLLLGAGLAIGSTVLAIDARPGLRSLISAGVAGMLAVALLAAGFEFTWNHLVCPPTGESGGSTASFLGHGSSYDCNNGVLTTR